MTNPTSHHQPPAEQAHPVTITIEGSGIRVTETVDRLTALQVLAFIDERKPKPAEVIDPVDISPLSHD